MVTRPDLGSFKFGKLYRSAAQCRALLCDNLLFTARARDAAEKLTMLSLC